jgi:hypothetical protein
MDKIRKRELSFKLMIPKPANWRITKWRPRLDTRKESWDIHNSLTSLQSKQYIRGSFLGNKCDWRAKLTIHNHPRPLQDFMMWF